MATLADPVDLFGQIGIGAIFGSEKIAIGAIGQIEGIAKTGGVFKAAGAQRILVVGDGDILPIGGHAQNG